LRALHRLVETEHLDLPVCFFPASLFQNVSKPAFDILSFEWETGQTYSRTCDLKRVRRRLDKNVDVGVAQIKRRGQTRALVITGDNYYRDPFISELEKRAIRQIDDLRRHAASKEQISAVNKQVNPGFGGVFQYTVEIIEEIRPSAPALDSRSYGIVKTQVCVSKEQQADIIFWVHIAEFFIR
jgi:hypothetical protein